MSPENTPNRSRSEQVVHYLSRIYEAYDRTVHWARNYTPYLVRAIEVGLAIVLLAVLAHWIYWVYLGS